MARRIQQHPPHRRGCLVVGFARAQFDRALHRDVQISHRDVEVHLLPLFVPGPGGWVVVVDPHHRQRVGAVGDGDDDAVGAREEAAHPEQPPVEVGEFGRVGAFDRRRPQSPDGFRFAIWHRVKSSRRCRRFAQLYVGGLDRFGEPRDVG
jgi:hypothetical protein